MEKRIQLKAVIFGVALAALVSARPILAQEDGSHCPPCIEGCEGQPPCIEVTFSAEEPTQEFNFQDEFGTGHKIKITANPLHDFTVAIQFDRIYQNELDLRLNTELAPANCIPYDGATANDALGYCGFYHVVEPVPVRDVDYSGDVLYKVFWNFPTLDQLHNVRLYRAPLDGVDYTCPGGVDCYTQDITGTVYAVGDSGSGDPGVGGKSKGFSDYEVVDLTSLTSPAARIWIGLKKSSDAGILFDLKAVVKKNGSEVSSGELLGAPGGGKGFDKANLLAIPLSLPADAFQPGDNVSVKLLVRNSCLASPQNSGVARLWYNDAAANSRIDEPGAPTLYLVRGDDDGEWECDDHGDNPNDLSKNIGNGPKKKKNVKVHAPVPSCDGPYKSFGKWSGTVPN